MLCLEEVWQMRLADPILAVLAAPIGRLCLRDFYAAGGSGLGQVT